MMAKGHFILDQVKAIARLRTLSAHARPTRYAIRQPRSREKKKKRQHSSTSSLSAARDLANSRMSGSSNRAMNAHERSQTIFY